MLELGQRRIFFVTGKGGTGKTSVCVGLARAMARRGKRVLLVEVDAPRPNLPSYFGGTIDAEPRVLAPRIEGANIDFLAALRAYVDSVVRMKRLVRLILSNKVVRIFLTATPGARELVLLSRVWEFSYDPRWDHIIVDLPASGHAVALFRCPHLAHRAFDKGPLRQRADDIVERFSDPEVCTLLFCALPGEMPINETLETRGHLEALGFPPLGGALLNRSPDLAFAVDDEALLEKLVGCAADSGPTNSTRAIQAVLAARQIRRDQRVAGDGAERLEEAFGEAVFQLPTFPGAQIQVADAMSLVLAEGLV